MAKLVNRISFWISILIILVSFGGVVAFSWVIAYSELFKGLVVAGIGLGIGFFTIIFSVLGLITLVMGIKEKCKRKGLRKI